MFCGGTHEFKRKEDCPAWGQTCNKCKKKNHYARKCKSGNNPVHYVQDPDRYNVFSAKPRSDPAQETVTFNVNGRTDVTFEIDTGASCNILPFKLYVKATGDKRGKGIEKRPTVLNTYDRATIHGIGTRQLWIKRQGVKHFIRFTIIKNNYMPILGLKSSVAMNLVKILDSDSVHVVQGDEPVDPRDRLSKEAQKVLEDPSLKGFEDVFKGLGELPGEYSLHLNPDVPPVVNAPRRVPFAQLDQVERELKRMVEMNVIAPVTTPTKWVSSLVVAPKPNGKIRICIDPQPLNKAIMRSHYPLPSIEQITPKLHKAKVFSVLDAKTGFWQVKLDRESSYLTTFNTPFGRFRWKRMPFGINSAPEVWQQKMNEIVENLPGIEVIADDLLVIGNGDSTEEAVKDHDAKLQRLLLKAREVGLKFNAEKLKLRKSEVRYMGHLLTAEGLKIDPEKVKALLEMPAPTDKDGVKRLLGFVNYLAKFMEHLSDISTPIRDLEKEDVLFCWLDPQKRAFQRLKDLASKAPVLRYYDPQADVAIQADASQAGLGFALMQQGQPVSLGSRAMTSAERNYAQIEKEMLAIVVACEKFDQYIYGKHCVVESDHKPLSAIYKKPLHLAPKRLQRMMLRLQKYDLEITYKPGTEMYLADTLSRAFPEAETGDRSPKRSDHVVESSEYCHRLEEVDLRDDLNLDEQYLARVRSETEGDQELQAVISLVKYGWPKSKKVLSADAQPYYNHRHELSTQHGFLFKGDRICVPRALKREFIEMFHASHLGVEGCLRRARECYFWPLMNAEVKDYVSKCSVCNAMRPEQCKEPLIPHEVPSRAWSKVGTDLFEYESKHYIVMTDYYSNWFEVESLKNTTTREVIREIKKQIARHGVFDELISDNGPQFTSEEFQEFAKKFRFLHPTSSPHYPQSNGKAENAVKLCKNMMKKCKMGNTDVYCALLDYRNTPSAETGCSPAH